MEKEVGYYCPKCDIFIPQKYIHGIDSISYSKPTHYGASYPCHRTCLTRFEYQTRIYKTVVYGKD